MFLGPAEGFFKRDPIHALSARVVHVQTNVAGVSGTCREESVGSLDAGCLVFLFYLWYRKKIEMRVVEERIG